jgi:hypothetical protein
MMMENEGEARIKSSYRGNYDRLTRVKKRYDPDTPQPKHPTGPLRRGGQAGFGRIADISVAATAGRWLRRVPGTADRFTPSVQANREALI